jgi:hypothetical protein
VACGPVRYSFALLLARAGRLHDVLVKLQHFFRCSEVFGHLLIRVRRVDFLAAEGLGSGFGFWNV